MNTELGLVTIGNAIVDILAHASEAEITALNLHKGIMTLIDQDRARALYDAMGPAVEVSGGCAANTAAGFASLGGKAAFIGKVNSDQLGQIFRHDIRAQGVHFDTAPAEGAPTACCYIFVTPDAERTLNTYLGACLELTPEDIDPQLIRSAKITYMEGYLWDPPKAKEAFLKAAGIAHAAGRKVALSLSDPFCVDRYRAEFRALIQGHIDILFANEVEICSLWEVEDFPAALAATRGVCELAALTRSEKGSVLVTPKEAVTVPAEPVDRIIDATGAGDLYASGCLYGLVAGYPLAECGRLGSIAAAEVISHIGARPARSLKEMLPKDLRRPQLQLG